MDRAYALLTVKAVQDDKRIIEGTATTPTPDRVGDIVEPLGVSFKNPLPLLWHHDSSAPVGEARFLEPTKSGIEFQAKIPNLDEPGTLKDRLDEVWQSLKAGLVKGVSIGFRAIDKEPIDKKDPWGGIRYLKSEVLELSLVTIPANAEATIDTIKSIDLAGRATAGNSAREIDPPARLSASTKTLSLAPKDATKMKTYGEQLEVLEARRTTSEKIMATIQAKCTDENRTKDEKEREEFDTAAQEIDTIDKEIGDVRRLEKINAQKAVPVSNVHSGELATQIRANPIIQMKANVPPGTGFTRIAIAKARSLYSGRSPYDIARENRAWDNTPEVTLALSVDIEPLMKAAVGAGTTQDATYASPLIAFNVLAAEFIEILRPLTIIGRIPGLTRVPFNIKIPRETASATVGWVGEDAPKPVSKGAFDSITMTWAKAAGICVLTEELVRFSNPAAETVVQNQLTRQMAQFLDRQFIDPTVAAITNVSPASITNGVTPVTASGTTMAAFRADARALLNSMLIQNFQLGNGVWIGGQQQAVGFATTLTSLGIQIYPGMTGNGGTLLGYPYIASENLPATGGSPADGYPLIFAIPSEILLADDGQTLIDVSREASVQMDTAPDSPPTAATPVVSFWQMNYVGIRAERWINWAKRRAACVGFIQNAKYAE
jgi:HK97 family phage major capsid protein/HK97 family phage prohead protease